ncbi:5-hydroxytryptamine receptor 1A-like [Aplochiton taeniatus]
MQAGSLPHWDLGNSSLLTDYLDIVLTVANSVLLCTVCFVGIAANLFVTWAVYHQKSLRTWNNALLVNLAVIDLLRCVIDCPILLAIHVTDSLSGHVDQLVCDAQVASFSFSCCIQLLTLACISAERYQAIAHPFQTSQRRTRILVFIALTWTLAILVALLCLKFVKDSPVYVKCTGLKLETLISYDTFGLYILVPLWSTCFGVIIGFYARIFLIVRAHSRKIFDKDGPAVELTTEVEGAVCMMPSSFAKEKDLTPMQGQLRL